MGNYIFKMIPEVRLVMMFDSDPETKFKMSEVVSLKAWLVSTRVSGKPWVHHASGTVSTTSPGCGDTSLNTVPLAWGADATSIMIPVRAIAREQTRSAVPVCACVDLSLSPLARLVKLVVVSVIVDRVSASAIAIVFRGTLREPSVVVRWAVVTTSHAVVAASNILVSPAVAVSRADACARAAAPLVSPDVSSAAGAVSGCWLLRVGRATCEFPAVISVHAAATHIGQMRASWATAVTPVRASRCRISARRPLVAVVSHLPRQTVDAPAALVLLGAAVAGTAAPPASVPALVCDTSLTTGLPVSVCAGSASLSMFACSRPVVSPASIEASVSASAGSAPLSVAVVAASVPAGPFAVGALAALTGTPESSAAGSGRAALGGGLATSRFALVGFALPDVGEPPAGRDTSVCRALQSACAVNSGLDPHIVVTEADPVALVSARVTTVRVVGGSLPGAPSSHVPE